MSLKQELKEILKKNNISPIKYMGQNFLIHKEVVEKMLSAAELKPKDTILEIGPGLGTLTKAIAQKVKKVIAIEKDRKMAEVLEETLKDFKNIEIIQGDILQIPDSRFQISPYKVVANLPFYITKPAIRKFLEADEKPEVIVLIVQKEVAQRIVASSPKTNLLAVSVQFYAEPEIINYVSKRSFWPRPKVDAAIIKIVSRQFRVPVSRQFREQFFRIVRAGFSHPRKQLVNNLTEKFNFDKETVKAWLLKNEIKPTQRAETLTIDDWLKLTKSYKIKEDVV